MVISFGAWHLFSFHLSTKIMMVKVSCSFSHCNTLFLYSLISITCCRFNDNLPFLYQKPSIRRSGVLTFGGPRIARGHHRRPGEGLFPGEIGENQNRRGKNEGRPTALEQTHLAPERKPEFSFRRYLETEDHDFSIFSFSSLENRTTLLFSSTIKGSASGFFEKRISSVFSASSFFPIFA